VEITVNATRLKGHSAQLTLSDSRGKTVAQKGIDYNDNSFSSTLTFELKAEQPGLQRYTARLSVVDGERTATNNVLTFYTDILDSRRKVAIIGNAPHPDLAALKQAVESNPNYEAEVLLAEGVESGKWKTMSVCSFFIIYLPPLTNFQLSTLSFQLSTPSISSAPRPICRASTPCIPDWRLWPKRRRATR
jgi:hypothetical protein